MVGFPRVQLIRLLHEAKQGVNPERIIPERYSTVVRLFFLEGSTCSRDCLVLSVWGEYGSGPRSSSILTTLG